MRTDWVMIVAVLAFAAAVVYASGRRNAKVVALEDAMVMKVRDIMSAPVVAARHGTSIDVAARLMLDQGVGCLPIVDETGALIGLVTDTDLAGRHLRRTAALLDGSAQASAERAIQRAARTQKVSELMSVNVVTAREEDRVVDAATRMLKLNLRHLPVVRDGIPVGVVARHDVLRMITGVRTEMRVEVNA